MSSTLVRYLIVAVLAYVIDMGGYYVLLKMGVDPIWANVAVKILAAICGFFMHRRFTYQIKEADGQMAHATKYFGLALLYTPISSVVLTRSNRQLGHVREPEIREQRFHGGTHQYDAFVFGGGAPERPVAFAQIQLTPPF